jgi:hypothetical protein
LSGEFSIEKFLKALGLRDLFEAAPASAVGLELITQLVEA